ncbi:cysteine desulfurase family protein [soil metagenome]
MARTRTYLDHNATSPLRPAARAAMLDALDRVGNASSVHGEGRDAHGLIDEAREAIARALGVIAPMVIFTSGGSEANNLAIKGAPVERLVVSAIEHPSVLAAARASGKPVDILPVDRDGIADLGALEFVLLDGPKTLISLMLANNETGVIQPVREAAAIAQRHGALLHVDAVQAVGKIPVSFAVLGADLLTVSAHKFGGPQGVGALVARDGLALMPLIHGGGQELSRRAGTENVAGIAGFSAAIAENPREISALRDRLESLLDDTIIFGAASPRLPNVACFARPGLSAETALIALDLDGIAVSSGSACSSGKVAKSHVLAAMGVDPELASCAIRVSLGWNTELKDIERFGAAWSKLTGRRIAA